MFEGVSKPCADESFSSWLYRIATTRRSCSHHEFLLALYDYAAFAQDHIAMTMRGGEPQWYVGCEAIDLDYDTQLFNKLIGDRLSAFNIPADFFKAEAALVTPWPLRSLYCPSCLREDVARSAFPYWRRTWTYGTTAYCIKHRRVLASLRNNAGNSSRAWEAFKQGDENLTELHRGRAHVAFDAFKSALGMRVQEWRQRRQSNNVFFGLETHASMRQRVRTKTAESQGIVQQIVKTEIGRMFDVTYSLLLKKRTIYHEGGYAKTLANGLADSPAHMQLSLVDRIRTGVALSDASQRGCALVLTGIVLGLFTDDQVAKLLSLARSAGAVWPQDPFEIGRWAINYSSREEYLELRKLYRPFPTAIILRCGKYFAGLEQGILVVKDEHSGVDRAWHNSGRSYLRWSQDA